ncbi:MAG: glycosyltransferase family 2 protein [Lachnospiraceae bacterium]|jgi:cellulose synthase/poly-beta-1,6-N-acetylglucosamine synthase-like glycosyltransferase
MWNPSAGLIAMSNIAAKLSFILIALAVLYQFFLAIVGLFPNRTLRRISQNRSLSAKTRFAIVIAARNEESVLAGLLTGLNKQAYPRELFDIFVIADNCTDKTAAVALSNGAQVFERFDKNKCSKGYALGWFFKRYLKESAFRHDAVVIFDADNIVEPDFLTVMDRHYQAGTRVAVGYRDSKNPEDSSVAAANSIFWLFQSRFMHQARTNLGLPLTSVSGTGFMFALDLIREEGWNTHTLTEDNEFTMQVILKGETPIFVREARFYDEQTSACSEMLRQRWRWSVGTAQTMRLMLPKLIKRILKGEIKLIDSLWFFLQIPVLAVISLFSFFNSLLLLPLFKQDIPDILIKAVPLLGSYLLIVAAVLLLLRLEGKKLKEYGKAALSYPFFISLWMLLQGVALFKKDTEWKPICHSTAWQGQHKDRAPSSFTNLTHFH